MIAIASLLVLVVVSLIVTRVATIVLVATGVSRTTARLQARSAFTGAGFTTSESEQVTDDPVRRKVIMDLMLIGHIGIVASASTLILGFDHGSAGHLGLTGVELIIGLALLFFAAQNDRIDRLLTRSIERILKRSGRLGSRDAKTLVELADHYVVCQLYVRDTDWIAGRDVAELSEGDEPTEVLAMTDPDHVFQTRPVDSCVIAAGSTLTVYGRRDVIERLNSRHTDRNDEKFNPQGAKNDTEKSETDNVADRTHHNGQEGGWRR